MKLIRCLSVSDLQTTLQREKYISHEISQSVLRMSEALKRERALREMIMLGVVWLAIAMMAFIGLVVIVPSSVQDGINGECCNWIERSLGINFKLG